jgi:hypothetical protein
MFGWKPVILLMAIGGAGCAPLCSPGTPDCHHTLTGWRYQPPLAGLVDNCPGEVVCGGGSLPTYQPDYGAMRVPQIDQRAYDNQMPRLNLDPSPMVTGPRGCPGIPLPGTNDCLLP